MKRMAIAPQHAAVEHRAHHRQRRTQGIDMSPRTAVRAGLLATLLACTGAVAQSYSPSELRLLRAMERTPSTLARYEYLAREIPSLSGSDRVLALQFLSFSQDELGLYDQAVFSFPLKNELPHDLVLPTPADWRSADAAGTIVALAAKRHIVMINEAHHDAHTRLLTLELLPRLRALGYTYFAAEALGDGDPDLAKRGYPTRQSGTEYLRDPLYGSIVSEAIRLGYTLVPYDNALSGQARDTTQAEALYRKVFARNPHAKLFVHAGYAHIDKATGRLGNVRPMAMELQSLTGFVPLSIDQTDFLETGLDTGDAYHRLEHAFPARQPEVLLNRRTSQPWSARPDAYDVNVILPPSLDIDAFGRGKYGYRINTTHGGLAQVAGPDYMARPRWLALDGARHPYRINSSLCQGAIPCVIDALRANEPDDAIAADRYAFLGANETTTLYLRPGRYRLRVSTADRRILSERPITVH